MTPPPNTEHSDEQLTDLGDAPARDTPRPGAATAEAPGDPDPVPATEAGTRSERPRREGMDLVDLFAVLRRRWWLVLLCVAVGAGVAYAVSDALPKRYTATTTLYATTLEGNILAEQKVKSYAVVATSTPVLQATIRRRRLAESPLGLMDQVTASTPASTALLELNVTDSDPRGAAATARSLAQVTRERVIMLETPEGEDRPNALLTVVQPAQVPGGPSSPRIFVNIAVGALLGAVIGGGLALVRRPTC